jgi:hypothetical protein
MEWISVEDGLPLDYTKCTKFECVEIIVFSGGNVFSGEFKCGPAPTPWYEFDDLHRAYVTHWMPLPEPPNKQGE